MFITPETITTIQTIGGIFSMITSITAIVIALRSEYRNNKRFQTQLELTRTIANANIKPLLGTYTAEYLNLKAITLHNYGNGTAVITHISFSKNQNVTNNIASLFHLGNPSWDTYWKFLTTKSYLKAGDKIVLVKLTHESLVNQGYSGTEAFNVLKKWQEQLNGIEAKISYEDILGNKQDDYERTYKS